MDTYPVRELKQGETLLIKTEAGSTYRLLAETTPEVMDERERLFRGFRATRESDHQISGTPEAIDNEPTILMLRPRETDGVLRAGDYVELMWDRDHPENIKEWDIQFGPKFHNITTSKILDVEIVPAPENS